MDFGIEPINDFIYCLQNDLPFIADGNDGLQAELIAEAVHESLEKRCGSEIKERLRLFRLCTYKNKMKSRWKS